MGGHGYVDTRTGGGGGEGIRVQRMAPLRVVFVFTHDGTIVHAAIKHVDKLCLSHILPKPISHVPPPPPPPRAFERTNIVYPRA